MPISFPVKAPQAKRMIACARPAGFGRGEQTLMDLSVRDTWEITPDRVTLTGLDWDAILTEVRDELGLPGVRDRGVGGRVLRRLPARGQTGQDRVPGHVYLQPAAGLRSGR